MGWGALTPRPTGKTTMFKPGCANTLSIALAGKQNCIKIRHTQGWQNAESEAKRTLGLTEDYFTVLQRNLAGMNDRLLTADQMAEFSRLLVPAKNENDVPTRTQNIRTEINRLFDRGAGNIGQSRWDALNAVTDYADHAQTLRGDNSTRLESSLLGTGAQLKQRAFDMLTDEDLMSSLLSRNVKPVVADDVTGETFRQLLNR